MPKPDEGRDPRLQLARILGLCLCAGSPALHALVLLFLPFQGRISALRDLSAIPWSHPLVLGALLLSGTSAAAIAVLRPVLLGARNPRHLLVAHLMLYALAETVSLVGLALGFLLGPATGPLALGLVLLPALAWPFLAPRPADWRLR